MTARRLSRRSFLATSTALAGWAAFCAQKQSFAAEHRAAGGEEWNARPRVFQVNREAARARLVPYRDTRSALTGKFTDSPYYRSLNGRWRFHWSRNPDERPAGFHAPGYDDSGWDRIAVPANWEIEGYREPIYLNIRYAWEGYETPAPPHVPLGFNPVGSYRRTFTVPKGWDGRRTLISFQGVKSAFFVWVNGERIGYSEDSYTPTEFDLTDRLRPGENSLAVEVYRWSDGSWLEDQDMIDLSGIFRDVYLYSLPPVHLQDLYVRAEPDGARRDAELTVRATVRDRGADGGARAGEHRLTATLYDTDGRPVLPEPLTAAVRFDTGEDGADSAAGAAASPVRTAPSSRGPSCGRPACGPRRTRTSTPWWSPSPTRPAGPSTSSAPASASAVSSAAPVPSRSTADRSSSAASTAMRRTRTTARPSPRSGCSRTSAS